jgi:S1-C subfamily serine protease
MRPLLPALLLLAAARAGAAAPAPPRDEATLAAFGAALVEDGEGLTAAAAGGPAAELGLLPGDRVEFVGPAAVRTRAEAAAALRSGAPWARQSLIVRRGLTVLALPGAGAAAPASFERGERDLSAREKALAAARAARDEGAARAAVSAAAAQAWSLRSGRTFWADFPDGLPAGLRPGDEVAAEVAEGLPADGDLDFLALPVHSRVLARVTAESDDGAVRTLRLVFHSLQPAGGRTYPILGAAAALSGPPDAVMGRVSSGGTLVVPVLAAADGRKSRGADPMLGPAARLQVRLLDSAAFAEAPAWWRAGPGLDLKAEGAGAGRRLVVSRVVAGRAAAASGLKAGDVFVSIAGRDAQRLEVGEALDLLYGPPGTAVPVIIARAPVPLEIALARGVRFEHGVATPLPLPFETR